MEKDLKLYLHFIGNADSSDQWNAEFSYYFSMVAKQILGIGPDLYSNLEVPAAKHFIYKSPGDLNSNDLIIIVLNSQPKKADFEFITSILPEISYLHVFIVFRSFPKNLTVPETIRVLPVYNFYDLNPYSMEVVEYNPESEGGDKNSFWGKMTDLVYDIKFKCAPPQNSQKENTKTIFLAEVSPDQKKNRERLYRDLVSSGYKVLPEKPMSLALNEFEAEVEHELEKSQLSIHIMGEGYGDCPDGSDYSYVEIQNRVYSRISGERRAKHENEKANHLHRIIWYPPVFDPFDDKQTQYLKRLKKEILNQEDSEILHSSLFDLKDFIDRILTKRSYSHKLNSRESFSRILVISDDTGAGILSQLEKRFSENGMDFFILKESPNPFLKINTKNEALLGFSQILLVQTKTANNWLKSIVSIILRSLIAFNALREIKLITWSAQPVELIRAQNGFSVDSYQYDHQNIENSLDLLISSMKP